MKSYNIGDPVVDEHITALVAEVGAASPDNEYDPELIRELIVTSLKLVRDDAGRGGNRVQRLSRDSAGVSVGVAAGIR